MSDLQFQESTIDVPRRFRSFYGRNIDQMPLLLADGRLPLTPRQLLYERVHGENEHDRKVLQDNFINTACAAITDRSGEFIVGLYSDPLVRELIDGLNPKSRLEDSSLPVGADVYQQIRKNNAFVISRDVANNLHNSVYSEQRVREGFWEYIAEGNAELVRDHLRLVQERRGGSMRDRMGLCVSSNPGLRLVCARSVGDNDAYAYGYDHLDDHYGRLVGVAPEVPGAKGARERAAQKMVTDPYREAAQPPRPSLEEVLADAREFVPEACWDAFSQKVSKRYNT